MTSQDVVLNIALNMSRLGRWAREGKTGRIPQFFADTQAYIDDLKDFDPKFTNTYDLFLKDYQYLKNTPPNDSDWSEKAYTWATILTHRAKLA